MYHIFLVEDDKDIRSELKTLLEKFGYACTVSDDFKNITRLVLDSGCHLVLLDLNLPGADGFHVCRELRKRSDVPVIIVTSRDSEIDELMSMNLGADDFVTKPYHTQILLARIESVLKRAYRQEAAEALCRRGLTLRLAQGTAEAGGRSVELTKNELRILSALMRREGEIVTREELMGELWQTNEFIDDNTLTVNITRLRNKLAEIGVHDFLVTRRGQGYRV